VDVDEIGSSLLFECQEKATHCLGVETRDVSSYICSISLGVEILVQYLMRLSNGNKGFGYGHYTRMYVLPIFRIHDTW
jgi:hypothetical protein